jgi:hypothetical protein
MRAVPSSPSRDGAGSGLAWLGAMTSVAERSSGTASSGEATHRLMVRWQARGAGQLPSPAQKMTAEAGIAGSKLQLELTVQATAASQ